jgi:hypothetical protein
MPDAPLNPLEGHSCGNYEIGDTVWIVGSGFTPGKEIFVGEYLVKGPSKLVFTVDESKVLMQGWTVTPDDKGFFGINYTIKPSDLPGDYLILTPEDIHDNEHIAFPACFKIREEELLRSYHLTPEVPVTKPCPDAPESRLQVDAHAILSYNPPQPSPIMEKPGRQSNLLGEIQPGEEVRITKGPRCADGMVWWKVVSLTTDLDGWTPEGDFWNYWLIPSQ